MSDQTQLLPYISDDPTGQKDTVITPPLTELDPQNYAALAFDPTNLGSGRLVLFIGGAYVFGWENGAYPPHSPYYDQITERYQFNDGSVVVAGAYVDSYSLSDIRASLDYSTPAGGRAILRTVDDVAYTAATKPYAPSFESRRGLLVINDAQSVTKRASDPYLDYWNVPTMSRIPGNPGEAPTILYGYDWSYFNNPNNVP